MQGSEPRPSYIGVAALDHTCHWLIKRERKKRGESGKGERSVEQKRKEGDLNDKLIIHLLRVVLAPSTLALSGLKEERGMGRGPTLREKREEKGVS